MKKSDMLQNWEIFAEVAQSLSFREVAEKFNVAPSSLTRRISTLEEMLDTKLLLRNPRGVTLTTEGKTLLQEAKILLKQLEPTCLLNSQKKKQSIAIFVDYEFSLFLITYWVNAWNLEHQNFDIIFKRFNRLEKDPQNYDIPEADILINLNQTHGNFLLRRSFVCNPMSINIKKIRVPKDLIEQNLISVGNENIKFGYKGTILRELRSKLQMPDYDSAFAACRAGAGVFLAFENADLSRYLTSAALTRLLVGWEGEPCYLEIKGNTKSKELVQYLKMNLMNFFDLKNHITSTLPLNL